MLLISHAVLLSVLCFYLMFTSISSITPLLLECDTAESETCKREFAQLFKQNFENCLHEYIDEVVETCQSFFDSDTVDILISSDVYTRMLYQEPFTICNDLSKRHTTAKETGHLMALFRDVLRYRVPSKSTLPSEIIQAIKQVNDDFEAAYGTFFTNIHIFWIDLYKAVREKDLKAFPEYFRLDAYMSFMRFETIPRRYEILNEVLRFLGFHNWFNFHEN